METYGTELQDSAFVLGIGTNHPLAVEMMIYGYSKNLLVLLTPREVKHVVNQLQAWLDENLEGK